MRGVELCDGEGEDEEYVPLNSAVLLLVPLEFRLKSEYIIVWGGGFQLMWVRVCQ